MAVTIKDIARLSGYSIGTVSRVINNQRDVSEAAIQKIQAVIEEVGYQPNSNARHLKRLRSLAVTVFVKGTNNLFLTELLEHLQEYLKDAGEKVNVVFLDESANEVETAIVECNERHPKGLIFLGADLNHFRSDFGKINVPSVLIAAYGADLGFDNLSSFCTDDYIGGYTAVKKLLEKGHRDIAVIGGFLTDEYYQTSTSRLNGALKALSEEGIALDRNRKYIQSSFSIEDGYHNFYTAYKNGLRCTALFALSDMIALGVLRAACDLGLRVPDDISIIGFDGIETVNYSIPRISTIRQDTGVLAKKGADDLLLRMQYSRNPVHERLPFQFIDGESIEFLLK
jgi:LacI family transcriptional regulator